MPHAFVNIDRWSFIREKNKVVKMEKTTFFCRNEIWHIWRYISLGHFIKHKSLFSEECTYTYIQFCHFFISFIFQPFFVERVFHIFDKDDNGSISLQEFIDAMHQFAGQSPDDKIKFLFKVYDIDGESHIFC